MQCSSCGKHKDDLKPRKSRLMTSVNLFLCTDCFEQKREPRWIIVLHGRANGFESVQEYIAKKRYVGADILAEEFV